jgi:hypothetical protein
MGGEVALMRFGQTTLRRLLLSVAKFAPVGYPPSPSCADGAAGTPGSRGYPARMATTDLDDDTKRAVRTVVGYVHRHLAQRPKGDVTDTRWCYSSMNRGHDPLK